MVAIGARPTRKWALARLYAPDGGHRSVWAGRAAVPRAPGGAQAGRAGSPWLPRLGARAACAGRRRPGMVPGPRERCLVPAGPGPMDGGGAATAACLRRLRAPQPVPAQLLRGVWDPAPANVG